MASTIKDYRKGEISEPTPEHVDRWVCQFDAAVQVSLLRELSYVLERTYFSRAEVGEFFENQLEHRKIAGEAPCDFWKTAHFLDIQEHGNSQSEIRALFAEALDRRCNTKIEVCGSKGGAFVYLDDVLFSGSRIGTDLSSWLEKHAPPEATVHILVIATHHLGEWQCIERLKKAAAKVGKDVRFHVWAAARFENRRKYRDTAEVLWPVEIPLDPALQVYMAEEEKFPFEPRKPGGSLAYPIFSSEGGRQLLERELLLAGMRIRSFSRNPSRSLRPLGFSAFGLGFGSMIVTFRNCPNNAPLSLWWGDPNAPHGHPFRSWYPLLPRKTYTE